MWWTGFRRWHGPALFLIVVVIAIGVAAAFLRAPDRSPVYRHATHNSVAGTTSVQAPVPTPPGQSAPPPEIAHSHAPEGVPEADALVGGPVNPNPTPPVAGVLSLLAPGHKADALAAPPPARAEPQVSEPETAKPVLLVYYPIGSRRGWRHPEAAWAPRAVPQQHGECLWHPASTRYGPRCIGDEQRHDRYFLCLWIGAIWAGGHAQGMSH